MDVAYAASFPDAVASIVALARPDDMVLTLGAGSVSQLGAMILETLDAQGQPTQSQIPGKVTSL